MSESVTEQYQDCWGGKEVPDTTVKLDTREPLSIKLEALQTGDLEFTAAGQRIVIERKTWPDLLSSLKDGRLAQQLARLRTLDCIPFLFIEGSGQDLPEKLRRNILLSIKLQGIIIEAFPDFQGEKQRVLELQEYFSHEHISMLQYRYSDSRLAGLCWIPGIGPKKAQKLLARFGSISGVALAIESELAAELGSKLASIVYRKLREV